MAGNLPAKGKLNWYDSFGWSAFWPCLPLRNGTLSVARRVLHLGYQVSQLFLASCEGDGFV